MAYLQSGEVILGRANRQAWKRQRHKKAARPGRAGRSIGEGFD